MHTRRTALKAIAGALAAALLPVAVPRIGGPESGVRYFFSVDHGAGPSKVGQMLIRVVDGRVWLTPTAPEEPPRVA